MTLPADPILAVERLSYRFPGGNRALDDVSFAVDRGERLAIVGPSGAGKSTLLLHLNGLLPQRRDEADAQAGAIRVNGRTVAAATLPQIRRDVGLLFQDPDDQLFCPTVREDVAFGPLNLDLPHDEVHRRIDESLAAVGLDGFEGRSSAWANGSGSASPACLPADRWCWRSTSHPATSIPAPAGSSSAF
jgi:cobalt/nickel transport system ATP-binding protein